MSGLTSVVDEPESSDEDPHAASRTPLQMTAAQHDLKFDQRCKLRTDLAYEMAWSDAYGFSLTT